MSQLIHTRNTSNMIELLESKFEEWKLNLTEDLKNDLAEIKNLIQNVLVVFDIDVVFGI